MFILTFDATEDWEETSLPMTARVMTALVFVNAPATFVLVSITISVPIVVSPSPIKFLVCPRPLLPLLFPSLLFLIARFLALALQILTFHFNVSLASKDLTLKN